MLLELIWRGRSHSSMLLAGGLCLNLVGHLEEVEPKLPLPLRILAGAGIITMIELGMGLIFNRDYRVWDYRNEAFHFYGQICPLFSFLWMPVSLGAMWLYEKMERILCKK